MLNSSKGKLMVNLSKVQLTPNLKGREGNKEELGEG
jgi:hypothetical protein